MSNEDLAKKNKEVVGDVAWAHLLNGGVLCIRTTNVGKEYYVPGGIRGHLWRSRRTNPLWFDKTPDLSAFRLVCESSNIRTYKLLPGVVTQGRVTKDLDYTIERIEDALSLYKEGEDSWSISVDYCIMDHKGDHLITIVCPDEATYIERTCPANMRKVLEEIKRLREEVDRLTEELANSQVVQNP